MDTLNVAKENVTDKDCVINENESSYGSELEEIADNDTIVYEKYC